MDWSPLFFRVAVLVAMMVMWMTAWQAQAAVITDAGVPAGFEQLARPRAVVVTLSYGGETLGDFAAHTAPGQIWFDTPEKITAAIPHLKNTDKLRAVLATPLPQHAELLCGTRLRDGCGALVPENIGIIYDDSQLNGELFVSAAYLDTADTHGATYLPLPPRDFSGVYGLAGAINGADAQAPAYTLTGSTTHAYGEGRLTTQTSLTDQGLRFDTAQAGVERNGWGAGGGLFRSHGLRLVSEHDMAGVYASTSLATRVDAHKTEGNQVLLYLPRRSFVSILRDGRLYSSRAYEAGNQVIDTSDLPEGAYTITLRIDEQGGGSHEEKRFFAKSPELPPADAPTYFAEAGFLRQAANNDRTLPDVSSKMIASAGTLRRLADNLGGSFQVLAVHDRLAAETGAFWMMDGNRLSFAALASTKGDVGMQAGWLYASQRYSFSLDAAKLWAHDNDMSVQREFYSYTQATLSGGYNITDTFSFGIRASYAQVMDTPASFSIGPYSDWRIWQEGESDISLAAAAARADRDYQGSVLLRFTKRFGNYGVSATGGAGFDAAGRHPSGNIHAWRDDSTPDETLLLGAGFSGDEQTRTLSADADWRNDIGLVRASAQQGLSGTGAGFSYGGNFAVNAAQQGDTLALGGTQNERSAVIIDVDGNADANMKIYVNNIERGHVKVGSRQAVYLSPFHTYSIRLASDHGGLIDYAASPRSVTLYPGTVVHEHWQVNNFYVIVAKLADQNDKPLAGAMLKASHDDVMTDEAGHFQAEIGSPAALSFTLADGSTCVATLPAQQPVNGVLMYEKPLRCAVQ